MLFFDRGHRYYVSRSLITKDRSENSGGLRVPAAEIEQLVSDRVHYGMLAFVVVTMFVAGLMVGRTPEYLGKKLEARGVEAQVIHPSNLSVEKQH